MKILITTQAVDLDDPHLNFFHDWLVDFARECEKVTVICLKKGRYNLPQNVEVLSLGKEEGKGRVTYISRLLTYSWQKRKEYDGVFVHMNPEYVMLCGLLWKALQKPIYLWYIHRNVDMKLRIAEKIADHIFSSTKESFRIPSKKVEFVGHGIDTNLYIFKPKAKKTDNTYRKIKIITIGRISQIKNCEILIEATKYLQEKINKDTLLEVCFVGDPVTPLDREYKKKLQEKIIELNLQNICLFLGSIAHSELPKLYFETDISVNLTPTGGMDKVVLESLSTGTPVITANEAFSAFLADYKEELVVHYRDPVDLAQKILALLSKDTKNMVQQLAQKVRDEFSRPALVHRIVSSYKQ